MLQVSAGLQLVVYAGAVGGGLCGAAVVAAILTRAAEPLSLRRTATGAAIALAVWFAIAATLAEVGFLGGGPITPPIWLFGLRIVAPVLVGGVALATFEPLRRLVFRPEIQPDLIASHTYRVIDGSIFLVLLIAGALPAVWAVPAAVRAYS